MIVALGPYDIPRRSASRTARPPCAQLLPLPDRRPDRARRAENGGCGRKPVAVRVSFLIPAYNEASTIGDVLERVEALPLDKQIVVVDDGSTDGTARIVERFADGRDHRGSSARRTAARGGDSAPRSRTSTARSPSSRTPTWSTTRPTSRADRADRARRRRRRLRLAPLRRQAAARVHVLAPRRQPLPQPADERPLQHDALGHGDGLQGVSHRGAALARPPRGRLRDRARDHGRRSARRSCGSTSCRSPTTAARTTRARRSPGATASRRSRCSCASASRADSGAHGPH